MAVQLTTVARKDDAGSRSLRSVLRSGATTAECTTRVHGTSYALYDDRFEVDPATVAAVDQGRRGCTPGRGGDRGVTVGRISQAAVEALLQAAPRARLCQQMGEVLLQRTPLVRPTGQAIEVLRNVALVGGAVGRRPVLILCVCG